MTGPQIFCPDCGTTIDARLGCPRCQMERGLGATAVVSEAEQAAERDELERRFPGYEIKGMLGRGGMGVVYRAIHRKLDRPVAIKVLSRELRSQPGFSERFEREARTLARLSHPGLVAIHDYGVAGDLCVLFLELVEGANLRELMDAGRMTPNQALDIVRQVCDALQYAHSAGVVHRDIKPENILVDDQGRVKIADFGLARLVGDASGPRLTLTRQVMGTPHYMAPEQANSASDVDHRADIFALGVLLYELLTGRLPVGRYKVPSETGSSDPRLDDIVMKAMEQEREQRYQDVRAVKRDLEGLSRQVVELGGPGLPAGSHGARTAEPVAVDGSRSPRTAESTFALTAFFVPAFAVLGILSMAFPWRSTPGDGGPDFEFVLQTNLWVAVAIGFLLPICVWDTFRYLMHRARKNATPDTTSRHWAGLQNLADLVGGGVAIAGVALYAEASDGVSGAEPTYLFAITIACGVVLIALGLIRFAISWWSGLRRFAIPARVALSLTRSVLVLASAGVASLWFLWVPPNMRGYPLDGRYGYDDPMGLAAAAAFVACAVIARGLTNAAAFRAAGLTCALSAVLAFILAHTRMLFPLWFSAAGPVVAGIAAIFLLAAGLTLAIFGPAPRPG